MRVWFLKFAFRIIRKCGWKCDRHACVCCRFRRLHQSDSDLPHRSHQQRNFV